jgi:hypothetical protein
MSGSLTAAQPHTHFFCHALPKGYERAQGSSKNAKRPWTRAGMHHVIHIRALIAREEWEGTCHNAVLCGL